MLEELFSLAEHFSFDNEDFIDFYLDVASTEDWICAFGQWKCLFLVLSRILKKLEIRNENCSLLYGIDFLTYLTDEEKFGYDGLWEGTYELQMADWHIVDTALSLSFLMEDGNTGRMEEDLKKYFMECLPEEDSEDLASLVRESVSSPGDLSECFGYIELYCLPWLKKAEQLIKTGNCDSRMQKILNNFRKINGVHEGSKAYFCPVYSLQGECLFSCYPSAFSPFKMAVYEAIAKAFCMEMEGKNDGGRKNSACNSRL